MVYKWWVNLYSPISNPLQLYCVAHILFDLDCKERDRKVVS